MKINIRKKTPKGRGKFVTYELPNDLQDWLCDYILEKMDDPRFEVFDVTGTDISASTVANIIDVWKFTQTFGASTMYETICNMKQRIDDLEDTVRWLKRDLGNIGRSWDEY